MTTAFSCLINHYLVGDLRKVATQDEAADIETGADDLRVKE